MAPLLSTLVTFCVCAVLRSLGSLLVVFVVAMLLASLTSAAGKLDQCNRVNNCSSKHGLQLLLLVASCIWAG
eukprot:1449100-Amphidinium_carterae.1